MIAIDLKQDSYSSEFSRASSFTIPSDHQLEKKDTMGM